ncbi:MAG: phosphatase PAP2 family protein [Gemmatimonadaceae bacterium]|nr:phosphatase PAP2 family protein [Gemmatimonadaceae bacterium]
MANAATARQAVLRDVKDAPAVDLFWIGVAIASTAAFAILTVLVVTGRTTVVDHSLIHALTVNASPALTALLLGVTFTSGRLAIFVAILFALLLYRRDGWHTPAYYSAACLSAQLINLLLKYGVHRTRPHGLSPRLTAAGGPSYPSGDVMMAVLIFWLGTLLLSRSFVSSGSRTAARAIALLFIIATAIARVYLGAHWPTDVVGGILAGVACSAVWAGSALSKGTVIDRSLRRDTLQQSSQKQLDASEPAL